MKYLKIISANTEIIGQKYDVVYYNHTNQKVYFKGKPQKVVNVGDILYTDGTVLKTITPDDYTSSLGTALGVCVIPSTHMMPRFIPIKGIGTDGKELRTEWSTETVDTELPNYTEVACIGHSEDGTWVADDTVTHTQERGYIPSDSDYYNFSVSNPYDTKTKWCDGYISYRVASPYNADGSMNPNYSATNYSGGSINNCLSDFNGKSNTTILVRLGGDKYPAASACTAYAPSTIDGVKEGDWYLPSAGEMGYVMARFKTINNSISKANGVQLDISYPYWSSTENNYKFCYSFGSGVAIAGLSYYKGYVNMFLRPFVAINVNKLKD